MLSQDQASHKLPDVQGLTWSGAAPAQATGSDTMTSVPSMLFNPNQAALGGQSPDRLVLHLDYQFTDNSDVMMPMSQFIAWKEDYLREGNWWNTNILMSAF